MNWREQVCELAIKFNFFYSLFIFLVEKMFYLALIFLICIFNCCSFFLFSGQQRASGLLPQWVFHFPFLHSGSRPAPRTTAFLGQPAATPAVVASGGEVTDAWRRDHDEADIPAVWSSSQDRHHTGGSWMVSGLKQRWCTVNVNLTGRILWGHFVSYVSGVALATYAMGDFGFCALGKG